MSTWRDDAACKGKTDLFFSDNWTKIKQARELCAGCPVKAECLAAGADEEYGMWGGIEKTKRHHAPKQRTPIAHGTPSGYAKHYKYGTRPCEACEEASKMYRRRRRAEAAARRPPREPKQIEHGTAAGAWLHRHRGEKACLLCRLADNAYRRGLNDKKETS